MSKIGPRDTERTRAREERLQQAAAASGAPVPRDEFGNAILTLIDAAGERHQYRKFYFFGIRTQDNQRSGPFVFFRSLAVLSNLYINKGHRQALPLFHFEGHPLPSGLHAFAWARLRVSGLDEEAIKTIMRENPQAAAIKIFVQEHAITPEQLREWARVRYQAMLSALSHKFGQNPYLSKVLLRTRDFHLVLNSPRDSLWGSGRACENGTVFKGLNLMGKALMEVRADLLRQLRKRSAD